MELSKYKKFLKDDNYVHCSICANFRNINSFGHRKSEIHQKKLTVKLRKIKIHLLRKIKLISVHDEEWKEKDAEYFCHFCGHTYAVHQKEDEFVMENLGCIHHHASSEHIASVKSFLKENFRTEKPETYCIQEKQLESVLTRIPELKAKYVKKMDILNDMMLKEIKIVELDRKKLITDELQAQASCSYECQTSEKNDCIQKSGNRLKPLMNKGPSKVPPWLEDSSDLNLDENKTSAPVIGPTMDTLIKHVADQKKKGLSKNRVGANFKHQIQGSSKWLPSFQGVWNQGRRKQQQVNFNWKKKKAESKRNPSP